MKGLKLLAVLLLIAAVLFVMGCERKIVNEAANGENQSLAGCFACHGEDALDGALLQAEGEWEHSVHASGTSVDYTNRGEGNDCTKCHDHQGFLDFIGTGMLEAPYSTVSSIHCFTCHAPHERGDMSLRTTAAVTLEDGSVFDHGEANLCANCHHARTTGADITDNYVITSTHWGAHHGPQGDVLNGTGGYEYAGVDYHTSPHKTLVRDGCIGCHMGNANVHDGFRTGGHSWNMVDEETGADLHTVCDAEGCHADDNPVDYNWKALGDYDGNGTIDGVRDEIDSLHERLAELLFEAGVVTESGGLVADRNVQLPEGVAGAAFNYVIVEDDRSHGAHNEIYIRDLLQSSIDYLESQAGKNAIAALPSHK